MQQRRQSYPIVLENGGEFNVIPAEGLAVKVGSFTLYDASFPTRRFVEIETEFMNLAALRS